MNDYRKYTPIKIYIFYILITLLVNLFGPWDYYDYNIINPIAFMAIYLCLSILTYSKSIKNNFKAQILLKRNFYGTLITRDGQFVARICIIFTFILFSFMIFFKIKEFGLPDISNYFQIMAMAYTSKEEIGLKLNLSGWIFGYFSIVYVVSVILGAYYFKDINSFFKIFYIINFLLSLFYYASFVGSQKAIGDLMIYISSVVFILFCQSGKKIRIRTIIFASAVASSCILLFATILSNRLILWGFSDYSVTSRAILDLTHWSLDPFSDNLKLGFGLFLYYLSHGYYGFSQCLDLPFEWSFGYGSSFALKEVLNKFMPYSDYEIASYPVRMEATTSWGAYQNWHTIFPWLASDFTYIGAIILMCLVMMVYAISWNRILKKGHWINVLLFCQLNILLVYVPANNQLFQTRASLIATSLIIILWVFNFNNGGSDEKTY